MSFLHTELAHEYVNYLKQRVIIVCFLLGLQVSGLESTIVGAPANISCSSDLEITNIVWLDNDMIPIVESAIDIPVVDLVFQLLPTSSHGQRYTCVATGPYGTQEEVVTISAQSELQYHRLHA